jgi:hypothetical protein
MYNRHAYCIIAHHDPVMLHVLVAMLDHPLNDIYIHIDKKADINPFLSISARHSKVFFLPERISVEWGGTSQIDVELLIFEYALSHGEYSCFHMMSGQDLPIKSQDYIHDFIDNQHPDCEFVTVNHPDESYRKDLEYKTRYYHFFVKSLNGTNHSFSHYWHYYLHALTVKVQQLFGVRRTYPFELKKSLHFVSVSHDFVSYLLSKKDLIKKTFAHTLCGDEIFLQSVLWDSPYREKLYKRADNGPESMRKVLWINHIPHIWENGDFSDLVSSPELFAVKVTSHDTELLLRMAEHNGCLKAVRSILGNALTQA